MGNVRLDGGNIATRNGFPIVDCNALNPMIRVTLVWTDSDTTKFWYGKTFENGESHIICFNDVDYDCINSTGGFLFERLQGGGVVTGSLAMVSMTGRYNPVTPILRQASKIRFGTNFADPDFFRLEANIVSFGAGRFTTIGFSTNIASFAPNPATWTFVNKIGDFQFMTVTSTQGITISWERVDPACWNTCGIP